MEMIMRKRRDYDAELKALEDKTRELKTRKVQQLGELVIATGADTFTAEELAGALVALAETKDAGKREAWAKRGAAFFRGRSRSGRAGQAAPSDANNTGEPARSAPAPGRDTGSTSPHHLSPPSSSGGTGVA